MLKRELFLQKRTDFSSMTIGNSTEHMVHTSGKEMPFVIASFPRREIRS